VNVGGPKINGHAASCCKPTHRIKLAADLNVVGKDCKIVALSCKECSCTVHIRLKRSTECAESQNPESCQRLAALCVQVCKLVCCQIFSFSCGNALFSTELNIQQICHRLRHSQIATTSSAGLGWTYLRFFPCGSQSCMQVAELGGLQEHVNRRRLTIFCASLGSSACRWWL
jgi:hypothetical protein